MVNSPVAYHDQKRDPRLQSRDDFWSPPLQADSVGHSLCAALPLLRAAQVRAYDDRA